MDFLPLHILASALIDGSLAVLCGVMLARRWLGRSATSVPSLRWPAALLSLGGAMQLLLLTASFTGKSSLPQVCLSLPEMLSTHAGRVLGLALAASAVLLAFSFAASVQAQAAALLACLVFRSGAGHAATENLLSLSQTVQFLHLGAMSMWSGAVLVTGLAVLPRPAFLQAPGDVFAGLLAALSRAATWALGVVVVTGGYRGYTGLGGDLHALLHSAWGLTLVAKLAAVAAALALGVVNRLTLSRSPGWLPAERRRTMRTLRAEACVMLAILALSATLANLPQPGE